MAQFIREIICEELGICMYLPRKTLAIHEESLQALCTFSSPAYLQCRSSALVHLGKSVLWNNWNIVCLFQAVKHVTELYNKWMKGKGRSAIGSQDSNMGNTTTKFRKALINGDENLACQIYESNPQLKETLDPNTSYGETYQHNTPLHYTARHGMNRILG